MPIHIGQEIKKVYKERGWTIEYFAEKVSMTPRNAAYLFNRKDISVEQLHEISKALDFDFMKLFLLNTTTSFHGEGRNAVASQLPNDFMSFSIEVAAQVEKIKDFPQFITRLRKTADDFGFIIK